MAKTEQAELSPRTRDLPMTVVVLTLLALVAQGCQAEPTVDEDDAVAAVEANTDPPAPQEEPAPSPQAEPGPDPPPQQDPPLEPTAPDGELAVHFLDVGQGDATLLVAPDAAVLVDTGRHDRSDVVGHLHQAGVDQLEVVAVTHPHADHLGQFDQVLDTVDVAEVWWSGATHSTQTFDRALGALEGSAAAYEEPRAGDATSVGSLGFEFVNPTSVSGDLHDTSLVFRVSYGDSTVLFTGDAEAPTEQRIASTHPDWLAADVYQVGHHGSSTSTSPALLDAVAPAIAVYSAGANNQYGHPTSEVLQRLGDAGVTVYGTDVHGTVTLTTSGDGTWSATTDPGSGDVDPDDEAAASAQPTPVPQPAESRPEGSGTLAFASMTSPVRPGGNATATVSTAPGAQCEITVTYKSGPSQAGGLEAKTADGDGQVSWTWMVGTNTTAGEWPIDVTCTGTDGADSVRTHFEVAR